MNNNSDNNSIVSIGTETGMSVSSTNDNNNLMNGGGIFSYIFGSNKGEHATEIILDAFEDNFQDVAMFIIRNSILKSYELNFTKKSKSSKTILHYLTICSYYNAEMKNILLDVLSSTNAQKAINDKDSQGNTPVHYSVYFALDDVTDLLVSLGADLTIKNNQGYNIVSDTKLIKEKKDDIVENVLVSNIFETKPKKSTSDVDVSVSSDGKLIRVMKSFVPLSDETLNWKSDAKDVNVFSSTSVDSFSKTSGQSVTSDVNSDEVVELLLHSLKHKKPMTGGRNNSHGTRKTITYSEMSVGKSDSENKFNNDDIDSDSDSANSDSEISQLRKISRAIENKASEAHKNAVEKIKEILGVSESEARAYKAFIYENIKKDQPELSNYDRAMELEKRASDKKALDKIKKNNKSDIAHMLELISEKSKNNSSESNSESNKSSESEKPKKKQKKDKPLTESSFFDTTSSIEID